MNAAEPARLRSRAGPLGRERHRRGPAPPRARRGCAICADSLAALVTLAPLRVGIAAPPPARAATVARARHLRGRRRGRDGRARSRSCATSATACGSRSARSATATRRLRGRPSSTNLAGGKFENLNALLAATPAEDPDWTLVVDDDVELPRGFLGGFLACAEGLGLQLAQPAHRHTSHAAWAVTRRERWTLARRTRLVEIGPVTAFHSSVAAELLPFPPLRMGWGLDAHWGGLARERGWRLGVVDATPIRHESRRPATRYDRGAAIAEIAEFLPGKPFVERDAATEVVERRRSLKPRGRVGARGFRRGPSLVCATCRPASQAAFAGWLPVGSLSRMKRCSHASRTHRPCRRCSSRSLPLATAAPAAASSGRGDPRLQRGRRPERQVLAVRARRRARAAALRPRRVHRLPLRDPARAARLRRRQAPSRRASPPRRSASTMPHRRPATSSAGDREGRGLTWLGANRRAGRAARAAARRLSTPQGSAPTCRRSC